MCGRRNRLHTRGRVRTQVRVRSWCGVAIGFAVLVAATGAAVAADAPPDIARGDPAARLPSGALAGDFWDVVARFESGHVLVATMALFDPGLGGRNAVAAGQLVEPDGTPHLFSRSERSGGWRLDDTGRRLDLRSVVLDQVGARRRFVVDRKALGIDVVIETSSAPAWPADDSATDCALDVIEIAGPATGSFRVASGAAIPLRGFAAITHRWMPGLETACMRRGIELFAMDDGIGLYLREIETPDGERRSWLVLQRDGARVFEGSPTDSEITWSAGLSGYSEPLRWRFRAPGISGRAEFGESLGTFEPLERLPAPLRLVMEQRTRPRVVWSAPRVELTLGTGREASFRGVALAKVAWTNPISGGIESLPATGDPAPGGN